jgi:hypothetical protein
VQQAEERRQQQQQQQAAPLPPRRPQISINEALHPSNHPLVPAFSGAIPASFILLLSEWQRLGLSAYVLDGSRRGWDNKMKTGFSRRKYLLGMIERKLQFIRNFDGTAFNGTQQQRLMAAAEAMDADRGRKTMHQFWQHCHNNDTSRQRRGPRRRQSPPRRSAPADYQQRTNQQQHREQT